MTPAAARAGGPGGLARLQPWVAVWRVVEVLVSLLPLAPPPGMVLPAAGAHPVALAAG